SRYSLHIGGMFVKYKNPLVLIFGKYYNSLMVKRSFEVAKKARWLWIYGILLGAGNLSGNIGRGISPQDLQNLPGGLPDVFSNLERVFSNWVIQLTPAQIITFFASITIFGLFSLSISFVLSSWAQGSLIFGSELALSGKAPTLENTSPHGLRNFMKLLIFNSISFVIAIIAFPLIIFLPGVSIYGPRAIVLKNYTPWNAWKIGLKMTWANFWKTLKVGLTSVVLSGLMGITATLVILIFLGVPGYFLYTINAYPPILLLFLIFISAITIINGFIAVFKTTLWNQVFKETWKE
ncbi:MAG: hypothetical protein AAB656_04245, partial [Patescibacteria group bacterium]